MRVKKLTKAEKDQLQKIRRASRVPFDELENVPTFVKNDEMAYEEFCRVFENFAKIGLLDNLDRAILAAYANAYSHYVKLSLDIQKNGDILWKTDKSGNSYCVANPAVKLADVYYQQMLRASMKMGLSSVDRLKLCDLDTVKKSNKYIDLLKTGADENE